MRADWRTVTAVSHMAMTRHCGIVVVVRISLHCWSNKIYGSNKKVILFMIMTLWYIQIQTVCRARASTSVNGGSVNVDVDDAECSWPYVPIDNCWLAWQWQRDTTQHIHINWLISFNSKYFGLRATTRTEALRIIQSVAHCGCVFGCQLSHSFICSFHFISVIKFIHFYISLIYESPSPSIVVCISTMYFVLFCLARYLLVHRCVFMYIIFTSTENYQIVQLMGRKQSIIYLVPARNLTIDIESNNIVGTIRRCEAS